MIEQFLFALDLSAINPSSDLALPNNYQIRTFDTGREKDWNEVHHEVFSDKKRHFKLKYFENEQTVFLPDHFFFVYHIPSGEPAGINTAQVLRKKEGYLANLDWIAVKPEHRGNGLGKILMESVHRCFKKDGFSTVSLRTAEMKSRESAQKLYQQMGWEIIDKGSPEEMRARQNQFVETPEPLVDRINRPD